MGGVECVRHDIAWNQAILLDKLGDADPLTSVADGFAKEELYVTVFEGLRAVLDHALQKEVGFLELVVEEEVALGELDVFHAQSLSRTVPENVEPREHPAAAGGLLVGDGVAFQLEREVGIQGEQLLPVHGDLPILHFCEDVGDEPVGSFHTEGPLDLLQESGRDSGSGLLFRCGVQGGEEEERERKEDEKTFQGNLLCASVSLENTLHRGDCFLKRSSGGLSASRQEDGEIEETLRHWSWFGVKRTQREGEHGASPRWARAFSFGLEKSGRRGGNSGSLLTPDSAVILAAWGRRGRSFFGTPESPGGFATYPPEQELQRRKGGER